MIAHHDKVLSVDVPTQQGNCKHAGAAGPDKAINRTSPGHMEGGQTCQSALHLSGLGLWNNKGRYPRLGGPLGPL